MQLARSPAARRAYDQVTSLQRRFVEVIQSVWPDVRTERVEWHRDQGRCGGGHRLALDAPSINQASINVSQVQYEHLPEKKLRSATALSSIIHPASPRCPSLHLHISWTEFRETEGYWRVMVDLNPSIVSAKMTQMFEEDLRQAAGDHFDFGRRQGDQYFYIPALRRHRGVSHFYLEGLKPLAEDWDFAYHFASQMILSYGRILEHHRDVPFTQEDEQLQLGYHTLYFFQVLTLDRGTTSGILVHDENDEGILGSLPRWIKPALLSSWKADVPGGCQALVQALIDVLPGEDKVEITPAIKRACATVLRDFYSRFPEQLKHQAQGFIEPARGHR